MNDEIIASAWFWITIASASAIFQTILWLSGLPRGLPVLFSDDWVAFARRLPTKPWFWWIIYCTYWSMCISFIIVIFNIQEHVGDFLIMSSLLLLYIGSLFPVAFVVKIKTAIARSIQLTDVARTALLERAELRANQFALPAVLLGTFLALSGALLTLKEGNDQDGKLRQALGEGETALKAVNQIDIEIARQKKTLEQLLSTIQQNDAKNKKTLEELESEIASVRADVARLLTSGKSPRSAAGRSVKTKADGGRQ